VDILPSGSAEWVSGVPLQAAKELGYVKDTREDA
jgi:hypothetical protein